MTTTVQPANRATATCHTWCRDHDFDFGFCHSDSTLIGDIDMHLAARDGVTRLYMSTPHGQMELSIDTAAALLHAGLTQVHLAKADQIVAECAAAGAR